jgi:RNA polymerase sigma factor (TIGR02999 family)
VSSGDDITALLKGFQAGDTEAQARLMAAVYEELRGMAARYMSREKPGHTLQATALVNEAYLRLVKIKTVDWQDRAHFYAVAAQVMRRILVSHARLHLAGKRGGGVEALSLDEALVYSEGRSSELVRLDDALEKLTYTDERVSKVIELRFFGGLSVEETASVLKISARTVKREWMFGRAWLRSELGQEGSDGQRAVGET